jgi:hypothetical protein
MKCDLSRETPLRWWTAGSGALIDDMQPHRNYRDWIDRLRSWTAPPPRGDERLPLGELERPFRTAVIAAEGGPELPRPADPTAGRPEGRETLLWRARTEPAALDVGRLIDLTADGPLISQDAYLAIEVWTDAELSALHALWWLADRTDPDCPLRRRLDRAARWHLEHTQPDNATNRPWAIHVFLSLDAPEADHYAETLLHNALASGFEVEPLAKWILIDTIRALEKEIENGQD